MLRAQAHVDGDVEVDEVEELPELARCSLRPACPRNGGDVGTAHRRARLSVLSRTPLPAPTSLSSFLADPIFPSSSGYSNTHLGPKTQQTQHTSLPLAVCFHAVGACDVRAQGLGEAAGRHARRRLNTRLRDKARLFAGPPPGTRTGPVR